jgi:hypothetical protein
MGFILKRRPAIPEKCNGKTKWPILILTRRITRCLRFASLTQIVPLAQPRKVVPRGVCPPQRHGSLPTKTWTGRRGRPPCGTKPAPRC